MNLNGFITGLVLFIISIIIVISFVIQAYDTDGYNIDLNSDENTKSLYNYSTLASNSKTETRSTLRGINSGLPGEENSSFNPTTSTGSDAVLQMNALSAVSQSKSMLSVFTNMLQSLFWMLGMDVTATEAFLWFLGVVVILPIVLMLLSTVLRNAVG